MATIFKRAPAQLSERRIDPWHYQPNFEKQIGKIEKNLGALSLDEIIEAKRGVAGGATPLGANYLENGRVKFYRTSEVEEMFLQAEDAVFISDDDDEKLKRSRLVDGDVLLTITGAKFGKSAVVSSKHLPGNISQHSVRFKPDSKKIDAHFLVAFLNGKTGQITIWREAYGATRPAIDFPSVRSLVVPKVSPIAQKYIGDKVRQAEQLRAWAKHHRRMIQDYFDGLFDGISLERPEHHHTRVSVDILVPRLNAEYYSDYYTQVEKGLISRFGRLTTLGRLAPTVRAKIKPSADCVYKEIGDLDVGKGAFGSGSFYKYGEAPNNAQRVFDDGDVAVSTRRPNRGAIAVIEESSSTTFYSVFLARLKPKDKNFGYWLKEFLRHDTGKLLLLQRCTWTTYPVISEDDIETIPVPETPDDWDFVARLSRQSVELEAFATNLTTSAKTLVEALIEGQLTEHQLIQAQQALEDGDNDLDQAILSKLSSEGYATDGAKPLFCDIDELYRLLESAAQAETEE
ncbi:restriction endonuclease subunit S [Vibrio hannami]|uniref:restriction endonuclease subunit S n=1 Tax=Vibrio hannami TaxID=2717094 RepID=UPI0024104586|nr:restriction endonuclease subunit S [Vibrio hannami]MDG3087794.1 restriction endonuclease subunit S [Vibrio hannami]